MSNDSSRVQNESLADVLDRKQNEVLDQLDKLNDNILALLEEFTARLKDDQDSDDAAPAKAA